MAVPCLPTQPPPESVAAGRDNNVKYPMRAVAFSPNNKQVAAPVFDHTVKVWEADTGQEHLILDGHSEKIRSVVFSPDGKPL